MRQLVINEKYCVLATVSDNKPYCSLMAYVSEEDCSKIYMVTHKDTTKYRNLMENSSVSLLIDTREKMDEDKKHIAKALTITGRFVEVEDFLGMVKARDMLSQRHPNLGVFLDHPEICLFAVEVHSFLLLDGFTDSFYEVIQRFKDLNK